MLEQSAGWVCRCATCVEAWGVLPPVGGPPEWLSTPTQSETAWLADPVQLPCRQPDPQPRGGRQFLRGWRSAAGWRRIRLRAGGGA
ncbi:MAG: hypothetical protein MZV64_19880 [Ignavibacteriales bacterium]|nr:hypothetical protein [Ignavibacteriales bacterium]